jgi:2'-5' RNA ligase
VRVAVAYLFNGDAAACLNNLRRCYDPKSAARIDAHVTIAGPVLWEGTVDSAAERLQDIFRPQSAFELVVDGISTFLPDSPTCFAVVGPRDYLSVLHDLIVTQLSVKERWPYVPHATISEFLAPEETAAVAAELQSAPLHFACPVDALSLVKQVKGGRWEEHYRLPLGDVR